jgi:AcrR family transcriptional regulator
MDSPASPRQRRSNGKRQRLLETASSLFYAEGIHAVGVDRIISETPSTRATFYRYFGGKEALVLAHIQQCDAVLRELYAPVCERGADPRQRLEGLLHRIGDHLCSAGFRGCPFINAAAEYPDPASSVRKAVCDHRAWFVDTLLELLRDSGIAQPERVTRRLVMLRDGAIVSGYLDDPRVAREDFTDAVRTILEELHGQTQGSPLRVV